jgi:hypothetical protein
MPLVRNDTTSAEGGSGTAKCAISAGIATVGTTGKPKPKQQDAHVAQECA